MTLAVDTRPPSERWYRVAAAIAAAGVVAAVLWWPYALSQVTYEVRDFARTRLEGGVVSLERGDYTLWIEGYCISCTGNDPDLYRERATVSVTNVETQEAVGLRPYPSTGIYNTGGREGRALWVLEVPRDGEYRVDLEFDTTDGWNATLPANVAFGRGVGLRTAIVGPMAMFAFAGVALGALVAGVVRLRRRAYYRAR